MARASHLQMFKKMFKRFMHLLMSVFARTEKKIFKVPISSDEERLLRKPMKKNIQFFVQSNRKKHKLRSIKKF